MILCDSFVIYRFDVVVQKCPIVYKYVIWTAVQQQKTSLQLTELLNFEVPLFSIVE